MNTTHVLDKKKMTSKLADISFVILDSNYSHLSGDCRLCCYTYIEGSAGCTLKLSNLYSVSWHLRC